MLEVVGSLVKHTVKMLELFFFYHMHGQNAGISRINAVKMLYEDCYDMHSQNAGISWDFSEPDSDNAQLWDLLRHARSKCWRF